MARSLANVIIHIVFSTKLRQRTMGGAIRVRLRKNGIIVEETDIWD
jgi:hypothetical protein